MSRTDAVRPHIAVITAECLRQLNSEVLKHSPCSPDQASSDYDLFCPPRGAVTGRHVASLRDVKEALHVWLVAQ
jgi:hypothetical protein